MEYISKQIEKICKDCGKPFIGDSRKRYCFDCLHKRDVERRKAWSEKDKERRAIRKQYKEEQKPKGMTLSDVAKRLADYLGVNEKTVYSWECGQKHLCKKRIDEIAFFFGVTPKYMTEGTM